MPAESASGTRHRTAATVEDLSTPALVIHAEALEHNLTTMAEQLPGGRCRPHVKAHQCTALARRQLAIGHRGFTCATAREIIGMAAAGLGEDLLLANETVDPARLAAMAACSARVTVAVDSDETVDAAATAGIREVVVDVDVGMPRCGCRPEDAPAIADRARGRDLRVRGVMGYEGHVVGNPDRDWRARETERSMTTLAAAHDAVGGDMISGGGTGTFDINRWCSEIQAGSYTLMDSSYAELGLPFRRALHVEATVISVSKRGWAVADCGLKALAMEHGDPTVTTTDAQPVPVMFCSDEHITIRPEPPIKLRVGDHVAVWPAHIDPTIARHDLLHLAGDDGTIVEHWAVDLTGWAT